MRIPKLVVVSSLLVFALCMSAEATVGIKPEISFTERELKVEDEKVDIEYTQFSVSIPIKLEQFQVEPFIGYLTDAEVGDEEETLTFDSDLIVGARGKVNLLKDVVNVDLLGEYKQTELDMEPINISGIEVNGEVKYRVYSLEGRVSKDFQTNTFKIAPYAGIVVSEAKAKLTANALGISESAKAEAADNIGFSLGGVLSFEDKLLIELGAQLIDEKTFSGSFTYRF